VGQILHLFFPTLGSNIVISSLRCYHHLIASCFALRRVIALMMEAASTSETLVKFYRVTRPKNPADSHLYNRRHEISKSYLRKEVK
jgi:hypothetical protein